VSDFIEGLREQARAALFPVEGELVAPGLRAPVTVARDAYGVPHIEAADLHDLWLAQGFVTAGERLFQIDLLLRAANGRLAALFGERQLEEDRFARTIGFHLAGAEQVTTTWTEEDHAMHSAFRAGVLAWSAASPKPVEYLLLDAEPDIPDDPAAWAAAFAYLAWGLSNNYERELLRASIGERLGPAAVETLMPPAGGGGVGSNAWAVAGTRTSSGKPLLANDPHLLAVQPGAWIEMHLSAPGYRARGVALTFSPGVLLGSTPHHAWGVTNVTGDIQDVYEERLNEDRSAALFRGEWETLETRIESIEVRGERDPHALTVRESRHGPILERVPLGALKPTFVEPSVGHTYALAWVGRRHGIRPSLTVAAADARDFEEFRRAALQLTCPGQNFVYADADGAIGSQCTGLHPVRRGGSDGSRPVPGWTGEHEWDGFIPLDELPFEQDPARGWIATANQRMHGPDYPHLIATDFHEPFRFRRIAQLLDTPAAHDVGSAAAMQTDTVSLAAGENLPRLLALTPRTDEEGWALGTLAAWDADMRADSAAAAVYHVWCTHIARRALEPKLGEDLFRAYLAWGETWRCAALPAMLREPAGWFDDDLLLGALADALAELGDALGADVTLWRWGAIHTLVLSHPLASIPGLEPLFVAARVEMGGDEQTVCQSGYDGLAGYRPAVIPSWRTVWDLGDLDRSVGIVPAGVSGNPASPHWNDQSELFAAGETKPTPIVAAEGPVSALRLLPSV
jgi:penicillin G amidase